MNKLCCEAECCRGDFLLKFEDAVHHCCGRPDIVKRLLDQPLRKTMDILAQNGIRLVYKEEWHIDNQRKW